MTSRKLYFGLLALLLAACSSTSAPAAPDSAPPAEEPTQAAILPTEEIVDSQPETPSSGFVLTSSAMQDGGQLPVTYTCDGDSLSPPLAWEGSPEGTAGYALAMHHIPGPGDTHWYWVVFNIPASTQSIEAGDVTFGTFGTNSVNEQQEYAPPCSQGPGEKLYTITVYALSASPDLPDGAAVDRDTLLDAIADITLAEASMDITYERE